jgi:hypothetical protein
VTLPYRAAHRPKHSWSRIAGDWAVLWRKSLQRKAARINSPEQSGVSYRYRSSGEKFLMTEDQIADLDDNELAMHISRVQHIDSADREPLNC